MIKEQSGTTGIVTIKRYKGGTLDKALKFKNDLKRLNEILDEGFIATALVQNNLVVSSSGHGRNLFVQRLTGDNSFTLNITHGEIGTGSTPPTNADTALTTPTDRVAVTLASASNNVATLRFFFADGDLADDTYNEFGTFVDGTITIGTGQMFNHALFASAYVKATGEDTTIDVEFTLN